MVKIAVDCRMLTNSGIGVYLKNILFYWLQSKEIQWTLIGKKNELASLPINKNCIIIDCDIPIFSYREFVGFPVNQINKCDLFYSPNFNIPSGIKVPIYVTIHDVVFLDIKGFTNLFGYWIRRYMVYRATKIAKKIFTVSEFSKQRLISYFGNKTEIIVAYNGLRVDLLEFNKKEAPSIYNFNYVLFIGNIKKHKGLDILIEAMKGLDMKLVIVGSFKNLKTSDKIIYEKIRLNKNILFEGQIQNDDKLYSIIAHASVLVQPSRYEGFGIPPLESIYLGTPAIVSDIQVFKEIYGKLPIVFFKDGDANDLKLKLMADNFPIIDIQKISNIFTYQTAASTILKNMS